MRRHPEGAIESNHLHAFGLNLFNGRDDGITAGCDQDRLGTGRGHIFEGGNLRRRIAILFSRRGEKLGTHFLRFGSRTFFHLDKERISFGLGDQA